MSDEQQESQGQQESQTPQPAPLPGSVFIRPGIDDRPDYDKALSEEDKRAVARLAVRQRVRPPKAASERVEVQAAQVNADAAPVTAAAGLDVAIPNPDSAFLDMRDPMVDAEGHRPDAREVIRLRAGFALAALLVAIPWTAVSVVLLPDHIARVLGFARGVPWVCIVMAIGACLLFVANALVAAISDRTRTRFGRRSPWVLIGGVVGAVAIAGVVNTVWLPVMVFGWCLAQVGYAMVSMPLAAAFGERVPDKFRDRADADRGIALSVGQLLGGVLGVATVHMPDVAFVVCGVWFVVASVVTLVVLPRERSSEYLPLTAITMRVLCAPYGMSRVGRRFVVVTLSRMAMAGASGLIAMMVWLAVVDLGRSDAVLSAWGGASGLMLAVMVLSFVAGIAAAFALAPLLTRWAEPRVAGVCACVVCALAFALPWLVDGPWGLVVAAPVYGFACTIAEGVMQTMVVSALDADGRGVAVYHAAGTLGLVAGALLGLVAWSLSGIVLVMFPVAAVAALIAAGILVGAR